MTDPVERITDERVRELIAGNDDYCIRHGSEMDRDISVALRELASRRAADAGMVEDAALTLAQRDDAYQQMHKLAADLKLAMKYAGHKEHCAKRKDDDGFVCSCGLTALRERLSSEGLV